MVRPIVWSASGESNAATEPTSPRERFGSRRAVSPEVVALHRYASCDRLQFAALEFADLANLSGQCNSGPTCFGNA